MSSIRNKMSNAIEKGMLKDQFLIKNTKRVTKDPYNVIDNEIIEQEKKERQKMILDRAQLRYSKIFDWVVNFILETISLLDLISDVAVLFILVDGNFIFIAVISLFVILSAVVVCYAPLINFFIARKTIETRVGLNQNIGIKPVLFTLIHLTPIITIQLLLIDLIYTFN